MHRALFLSIALCVCRKPASTALDASVTSAAPSVSPSGKLELTREKLDAYVSYQQAVLDKGPAAAAPIDRARREEQARAASGLSDEDVRLIDEMVSSVVARRMVSKLTASQAFNPDPKVLGSLTPEQRKRLEEASAAYKAAQTNAQDLADERKKFGSANIDLLLTREAEIIKNWSAMMGMPGL
jgi:hypothetical protein